MLSNILIKNLKPEEKEYTRREKGGFGIRVLPSGTKTFFYLYRVDGKRRFLNLGEYKDKDHPNGITLEAARSQYIIELGKVTALKAGRSDGQDPLQEKKRESVKRKKVESEYIKSLSVSELTEEYLTKHAKKNKSSWQEDERILNKDVIPVWGDRKAKDITRRDVLTLIDSIRPRGNGITTNTFKIIRRMFRFAVKQEIIDTTPCYAFEKGEELPIPVSKERALSETEVKSFMKGIDSCAISKEVRSILKLILLTGQRPDEVCSMHRSEIDGKWWEFTPKETVITKQIPRKQRIYLTDTVLQLIGDTKDYIFQSPAPNIDKEGNPIPTQISVRAVSYALRRNLTTHVVKSKPATHSAGKKKRSKPFKVAEEKKLTIEKFTPHDLRRTCATMISEIGYPDEVVDAILAHLKKGEIRTYNKNKYDKEKQAALQSWEVKLKEIIEKENESDI